MEVKLVKNSKIIGRVTGLPFPKWSILHDGKFVCGGRTQKEALEKYTRPDTAGTIQNLVRLGQFRKAAQLLK